MLRQDDLHAHFSGALHNRVKVVYLEPQQDPISVRLVVAIGDRTVIVFHFEAVQLKDKLTIGDQLLVCGATMITLAAQQSLIPSAASFHIGHGNEGLRTHDK